MAGTARRFAALVGEHLRQAREVRSCELQVDPVVSGHPVPEVFDDRLNGVQSTESLIQSVCHGLPLRANQVRGVGCLQTASPRLDYSPYGRTCQYIPLAPARRLKPGRHVPLAPARRNSAASVELVAQTGRYSNHLGQLEALVSRPPV